MAVERWERIKLLVADALARRPEKRARYLDEACGNDRALRREVESLLAAESQDAMDTTTGETLDAAGHFRTLDRALMALREGTQLGPYEILAPLGAGGMGEVYRAQDTRLDRTVAIKVLPEHLAAGREQKRRFEREAKAISQLNHPHICTLHDVGHQDGVDFLVMEYIEGETLSERLADGAVSVDMALEVARQVASGLERAHAVGIVHRDLKPGNIMLTDTGVKLLDFGLAKFGDAPLDPKPAVVAGDPTTSPGSGLVETKVTQQGVVLGTVPYMSPEQAKGHSVDELSDQFSFGVVLFEMLAGERPFQGDSTLAILDGIINRSPPPLREVRADAPPELAAVVARCLEKRPVDRYPTITALGEALERCQKRLSTKKGVTIGWRVLVPVAVAAFFVTWLSVREDIVKWSERDTLEAITSSTEAGDLYEAFRLTRLVREKIPDDEDVRKMEERITIPISIVTDPPGAMVELAAYDREGGPWTTLGETPLPEVRVPYALVHWRISKQGYETFEGAPFGRSLLAFANGMPLQPEGARPAGMVFVPGGPYQRLSFNPVELQSYWLDRHEVTNVEFKRFVDAGGYESPGYWTEPFQADGRTLAPDEAMTRLVDTTDRAGPSGWVGGTYEEGLDDYPVGGVSWYEAAAYCRFAGKSLPTLFHWSAATAQDQLSDIVRVSNFDGDGPVPVGERLGLGDFGNYDMAGNVKEWSWNEGEGGRYILGGAWGEPTSRFRVDAETMPALSRELTHGFRCARYDEPVDASLRAPVTPSFFTELQAPVPDEIFDAYRRIYAYDESELEASIESIDESSPTWRKELVSFRAAYGGERVIAHLFLPRNASPPYQPVIWFPGNDVFFLSGNEALASPYLFDFIPSGGRALVYPVYKGMYERHVPFSFAPNETRDLLVMWSKDLGRTIDYLEERADIDAGKTAYYGFSSGALYGPVFTAIDTRFKASILLGGGLDPAFPPEANAIHFAPRSTVPTLMINGRDDFISPYEILQKPFFDLLGSPESQKWHARLEGGHIPPDRAALIREVEDWLDRYLGPVLLEEEQARANSPSGRGVVASCRAADARLC